MHPVITVIEIGSRGLPLTSYGLLVCCGICVAAAGVLRAAQRADRDLGACIAWLGMALGGGFAGALLLHGSVQAVRLRSLQEAWTRPGLASFGALLGLSLTTLLAARALRLPVLELTERALPALLVGQGLGRIGCLLGGCCFGIAWNGPFAAALGLARHPVPLYEALALFALAALYARPTPPDSRIGRRLGWAVVVYCGLRLALEMLRGDAVRGVFGAGISAAQVLAAATLIAVGALLRVTRHTAIKPNGTRIASRR